MNERHSLPMLPGVLAACLVAFLATGCGEGTVEPPPPPTPVPTTLTISPGSATLQSLGETSQLTAEVRDQNGQAMANAAVTWTSSDPSVATVAASGLVTAVTNGAATVTATAGSASGTAAVTVDQVVAAVVVDPAADTLLAFGDTLRLSAEALDANGNVVTSAEFAWESSDASVATVDVSGLLTAVANGVTTVTVTTGSASGTAAVTVAQTVATVAVEPAADTLSAFGDTLRLSAEALDANANVVAGTELAWSSGDNAVATVDDSGLVTAAGNGTTLVTATAGSVSGIAAVTVAQVPAAVVVEPAAHTLVALGDTIRLLAEARDANANAVAAAEFAWTSSDVSVATVDASGLVTAVAEGSVVVTATAGPASGTAAVTVGQEVGAVTVSPAAASVLVADTVRLSAAAADANGHPLAAAEFTWASRDTLVAVVDGEGLVTATSAGETEITAASAGVTGRASLTVVAPVATTVAITPDTVTLTAFGQSSQLGAEVRDQGGRVMEGVAVSWSSGDTLVATVDSGGMVTAAGNGTTTVAATADSASGMAAVTVMQSAGSVVLAPATDTIAPGDTLRLAASAFDGNGHVIDATEFEWLSSDVSVARVDASGLVTALSEGRTTVTAVAGDLQGTAEISVENPDRAALVALYNATDGPNWLDNSNWLTDAPLGEWYGVSTDRSGRVVALDLGGEWDDASREFVRFGLKGRIPSDLGSLTTLESLTLSINALSGSVPRSVTSLQSLEQLDISYNGLTGPIPLELGTLIALERLNLNENRLVGPIPSAVGDLANLVHLDLSNNELTGRIPPEIGSLLKLRNLDLSFNGLTSVIPPTFGNLTELVDLDLYDNQLTGEIPSALANLDALVSLRLGWNVLTGPVPNWLGNLTELWSLGLSNNEHVGEIPPELGNLTNLRFLSLDGNALSGSLPPELGNLRQLRSIRLSDNKLTGTLPMSFLNLHNLETLGCGRTEGVCAPATDEFREWERQIKARGNITDPFDVLYCDEIDKVALRSLSDATSGSGWVHSDGWFVDENLDQWHGVRTDSIGRVSGLDLTGNGLAGYLPAQIGQLANLTELKVGDNALTGQLPLSLRQLSIEEFDYTGTSLCVPDDTGFRDWLNRIPRHNGTGVQCPPLTERDILEIFYQSADGPNWNQSKGWRSEVPLRRWHGVQTNASGHVVGLSLPSNGLTGAIPAQLSDLQHLELLDLPGNQLTGAVPPDLGDLDRLELLDLSANQLSGQIPEGLGRLGELRSLRLENNELTGSVPSSFGGLDRLRYLGLSGNQLSGEIPEGLGRLGELRYLRLQWNELTGSVPSSLGGLERLVYLNLSDNRLSGEVPKSLGRLAELTTLELHGNDFSGPLPKEFGALAQLQNLRLADNHLVGSIPAELGNLSQLVVLDLSGNELSGPLPAQLGHADKIEQLDLGSNALVGPLPPEFGSMALARSMILANNAGLDGPLPTEIVALGQLERFMAGGTGLCRPAEPVFDTWFRSIPDRRILRCAGGAAAYLTQSVQSVHDPVPLLAGAPALLRVFVTAPPGTAAKMPDVRATFFVDGIERHTSRIPGSAKSIPAEVADAESALGLSVNADIPEWVIAPGLEMVIEVDPERTLDPAVRVVNRIPETGRMPVDVRRVPPLDLTLIPFLLASNPDSSAVNDVAAMASDPYGHELLRDMRTLLPITELSVVAHDPVMISTPDSRTILQQVHAMRVMEGGTGYWMGISDGRLAPGSVHNLGGLSFVGGSSSMSLRNASVIAHELGHNLSLLHAPCGDPLNVDPWFPHVGGTTGAWGYDVTNEALVPPTATDVMSYCYGQYWISDFFFNKALSHRIGNNRADVVSRVSESQSVRTLLVWGGRNRDGSVHLNPAFVVNATPNMPTGGGEYAINGLAGDGASLFSVAFDMPVVADAEGEETSFVFAVPVEAAWGNDLASITLSGPDGSATLDKNTHRPMAILRDRQTGQLRAFLSDPPLDALAMADAVGGSHEFSGLVALFSRGIPGTEAWITMK